MAHDATIPSKKDKILWALVSTKRSPQFQDLVTTSSPNIQAQGAEKSADPREHPSQNTQSFQDLENVLLINIIDSAETKMDLNKTGVYFNSKFHNMEAGRFGKMNRPGLADRNSNPGPGS